MKQQLCANAHKGHTTAVVLWQRVLVMLNQAPLLLGQAAAEYWNQGMQRWLCIGLQQA